jgi:beta-lactam-binding protein with PASTA domain
MSIFLAEVRRFWWAIVAAVSVVLFIIVRFLGRTRAAKRDIPSTIQVPNVIQEKLDTATEAALLKKVEVRVKAQGQKEILDRIGCISDGPERRKALADFLRSLK